jgi:hypothetical protein
MDVPRLISSNHIHADAGLGRKLAHRRPLLLHHHGLESVCPGEQAQQAAVWFSPRPAVGAFDQEPHLHPGASEPGRDGKDEGRRVVLALI